MNYAPPVPMTIESAVKKCRVLGTLEGKITKIIKNGDASRTYGFELTVTVNNPVNGATWEQTWTVWDSSADGYTLDQHVIVTGDVSWKYETYNRDGEDFQRETLKGSVNNPHVKPAFNNQPEPF